MRTFLYKAALAATVALAGLCRAASDDYLIVDLSKGSAGPGPYPISYASQIPDGGWTSEHKTSKLVLRKIPRGGFMMGSPTNEPGRATNGLEMDQRWVTVSNDFYLGVFELTEGQYQRIRSIHSYSTNSVLPAVNHPVEAYSVFLGGFLSALNSGSATNFSIPSEAQWEYACRAGTTSAYSFGSDTNQLTTYAWYSGNAASWQAVGGKTANPWGLFDMHGNAEEACWALAGTTYIVRGGDVTRSAQDCRSASRQSFPDFENTKDGFRVCLTVPLKLYTVTVTNGTAEVPSGTNGQFVAIWAQPPGNQKVFDRWTGDTRTVQNIFATSTTVRIQGSNIAVTATYKNAPYTLTVINGSGDGQYASGDAVAIVADPPAAMMMFDRWKVVPDGASMGASFDPRSASTVLTMPAMHLELTAVYTNIPTYALTLQSGTIATNSASYGGATNGMFMAGAEVPIVADPPTNMQVFIRWQVVPEEADLGTNFLAESASTTLTMPAEDVALTAVYTNIPTFALTVVGGQGSGNYTNGQVVAIAAPAPAAHFSFLWTGDTATVADTGAWETTLVMPAKNTAVTATYSPILYPLTVGGGTGGGAYPFGTVVTITATNKPSAWHAFDAWLGDTLAVADLHAATTTVTIAGATALASSYRPVPVPANTYMVVDLKASQTNAAVSYLDEVPEDGWTPEYLSDKLVLRKLLGGSFIMGSAPAETDRLDESQHAVKLTKVFYMGLFEVTQGQWKNVVGTWPSAYSNEDDRVTHPVERVSYVNLRGASNGAKWPASPSVDNGSFIGLLRAKTGDSAFDLPTEAQWEYACRAGTTGAYAGPLNDLAVYSANSGGNTWAVGQKAPNAWGLYDMHGNVYEICLDWYAEDYSKTNQIDPKGAVGSVLNRRIMRGGSYLYGAANCRSAYRGNLTPTNVFAFAGLRVARTAGALYPLTVIDGTVNTGGLFLAGTKIPVSAVRKGAGAVFSRWVVQPANARLGALFVTNQADTVVTMPTNGVVLTATYRADPNTTALTVTGGTGTGSYTNGQSVTIAANPPPDWYRFDRWTGDTAGVSNVTAAVTTVWMGGGIVNLTATYRVREDLPEDVNWLQVIGNGSTNRQLAQAGAQVAVTAPAAPAGKVFGGWLLSPADADLGAGFNVSAASTTLVMPATEVTVTAFYVPNPGTTPGYVNVRLTDPSGVPLEGARWSPDAGKTGYPAGLCPLKPATYTLTFLSPGVNWIAPANLRVSVKAGVTAEVSGVYQWVPAVGPGGTPFAYVGVPFKVVADIGPWPATVTAMNLPPGLKLNSKNGLISGVPTKAGAYVVSVTAKGADGSVSTGAFTLTVVALAPEAQGTFTGYAGTELAETNRSVKGLFTMTVSAIGKISAKVTVQQTSYSFSGASWTDCLADDFYRAVLRTSKGETLDVVVNAADGSLTGVVTNGAFGVTGLAVAGQRNAFLNTSDAAAQAELSQYKGYYTLALPAISCRSDGLVANEQSGAGYLTLTVKDKGAVALAGKLAEGTSFSASTTLLSDGDRGCVPVFVPLYSKRGVVSGLLTIHKGDPAPASNRVEHCDGVLLEWLYPGKSSTLPEDRFAVAAAAVGAFYDTLISLQAHYAGTGLTAEAQPWDVPLAFKPTGAVYLAAGPDNPAQATLSVVSKTGLFSGSFKEGTASRKYFGILIRDGSTDIGLGAYVAPQTVTPYTAKPSFEVVIE